MFGTACVVYSCRWLAFFLFKQKTSYEVRISDWSSDVCSFDLEDRHHQFVEILQPPALRCDHETIYRASPEPAFTCIGHLLGAADEVGAWNGEPAGDLPQRQLFFFGNALDVIGDAPIGILAGIAHIRERLVRTIL